MGELLKVFNDCEDLDDEESLRLLCHIFKAIVGLNDGTLLEVNFCYLLLFSYIIIVILFFVFIEAVCATCIALCMAHQGHRGTD